MGKRWALYLMLLADDLCLNDLQTMCLNEMEGAMTRQVIVAGDTLAPYGGEVLSGSDADKIDGKSIARKSDLVRCAKHDTNPIEEGDDSFLIDGKAVALEGHRAGCGCMLVSRRATLAIS